MSLRLIKYIMCGCLSCLCISVSNPSYSISNPDSIYRYTYLIDGESIILDQGRKVVSALEEGESATFCSKESGFYCVNSRIVSFAVPVNFKGTQSSWKQDGKTYEVVNPLTNVNLFDHSYMVIVIKSVNAEDKLSTYYFYSPSHGLLGWEIRADHIKEPLLILMQGKFGFAAQQGA